MKRAHLIVGILCLLAFAGTGQTMIRWFDVPHAEPLTRLLYRSSHLYLFFAAVINTLLGCYWQQAAPGWRRILQWAGSVVLLISAPALLALFFVEPGSSNMDRPYTYRILILTLVATVAHLLATTPRRAKS